MSDLPKVWLAIKLGQAVDYGRTEKIEPNEISNDDWILELEDIERDTSKIIERVLFSKRKSRSTKNKFNTGDVLYGKLRPYLNKVVVADSPGFCTTEIIPLKPNEVVFSRYLFYWLKHPAFLEYVNSVSHGLSMPRLGTEAGKDAPFILAPTREQQRIADKLDILFTKLEATRERLDRIPRILKKFRQSVLSSATSGKLSEMWRDENDVKERWIESDIQSVASVGTGSTPLRSNPQFYAKKGIPWVTSAATSNEFIYSSEEFVTDAAIKAHRLKLFPAGTLLVAMYGEGKTRGQVAELNIEATINQACAALRVDEKKVKKAYVKFVLQANYLEMRMLAEGGNQPNLNLSKVKEFPITLPPISEQNEIIRRVEKLFAFADKIEVRYRTARAQVDKLTPALLEKAFRGELVEQDPNDEPADKLLERIKAGNKAAAPAKKAPTKKAAKRK